MIPSGMRSPKGGPGRSGKSDLRVLPRADDLNSNFMIMVSRY